MMEYQIYRSEVAALIKHTFGCVEKYTNSRRQWDGFRSSIAPLGNRGHVSQLKKRTAQIECIPISWYCTIPCRMMACIPFCNAVYIPVCIQVCIQVCRMACTPACTRVWGLVSTHQVCIPAYRKAYNLHIPV